MTQPNRIRRIARTERFKKAYAGLSRDLQEATDDAIRDLVKEFIPQGRRFAKLGGFKNPRVYVVHVTTNHSHKLSLEIDGDLAILRSVDTHKVIDKKP